ncbi:MAG: hypothetical protein HY898_06755 [Deltaproteobacteria bacterium]|nr:hypothetical protein [Deltaproteobacteria bacterium]
MKRAQVGWVPVLMMSLGFAGSAVASEGTPAADGREDDEVIVEVTSAVAQQPLIVVESVEDSDRSLANQVSEMLTRSGQYASTVRVPGAAGVGAPASEWAPLQAAAVSISSSKEGGSRYVHVAVRVKMHQTTPAARTYDAMGDSEAALAARIVDGVVLDVTGARAHMSGRWVITDATTSGERATRVVFPSGKSAYRVSPFAVMARGADWSAAGTVYYAAEDRRGVLSLFQQGEADPVRLAAGGFVQGVSVSPDGRYLAVSIGESGATGTWVGTSFDQLTRVEGMPGHLSLSPSINDRGEVVHAVGPPTGPLGIELRTKRISPPGVWAASPSFCSTATEERVAWLSRVGSRRWDLQLTTVATGATWTVARDVLTAGCSPDGRSVAAASPASSGRPAGVDIVSDRGGARNRVWQGTATSIRWGEGERLPLSSGE